MKTALIQTSLSWENPSENRASLQDLISSISQYIDLIVLPEMFTSGFTMNPEKVAETMQGETISWLKELAQTKNCAITGSLVILENRKYYNRLVFVFPSGEIQHYDKTLTTMLRGKPSQPRALARLTGLKHPKRRADPGVSYFSARSR